MEEEVVGGGGNRWEGVGGGVQLFVFNLQSIFDHLQVIMVIRYHSCHMRYVSVILQANNVTKYSLR